MLVIALATAVVLRARYLVSRIDHAESLADIAGDLGLIAVAGVLAAIAASMALLRLRDRQALRDARVREAEQHDRLQAMRLLDSIVAETEDTIFAKDSEGRFLLFNRAGGLLFGHEPEDVIGRTAAEFMSPETALRVADSDSRVIAANRTIVMEQQLQTPGGMRDFVVTKGPLRNAAGEGIGLFGIYHDVTPQKLAETRLREAAEFVRAVEDSVLEHMAVLDRDAVILSVNATWRQFFSETGGGTNDGNDIGRNFLDICREAVDDTPEALQVAEGVRGVLAGELKVYSHEYACHTPRGDGWFAINVTPLRTAAGGAVVVHTDITERRRNEAELKRHRHDLTALVAERSADLMRSNRALVQTEAFLRTVADNLPGRVAYWNADTLCGFVNQTYCEWIDKTADELIGRSMAEIYGPAMFAERETRVRAALAGEAQHFEREEVRRDGRWAHSFVHYVPDRQGDAVRGFFVLANDITEVKQAELALQRVNQDLIDARNRAETATQAKSAFLANMSHEIRTPMNAIIGLTHLLERDVQVPAQRDRLAKVSDAAHHLLGVINDVLDLSKIESGKLMLEETDFALDALLSRACALVADKAREKGLELVINTDDLPRVLHGDVTRISQALLNLLGNAVKFTERGSISVRGTLLVEDLGQLRVRFEVRDSGVGIAPERIGALFTAFEQADASTTRRFGGTGLGLAITRQLAELMGGEAGADSVPGVGSRFWFTARLRHAADEGGAAALPKLAGARVLLTDDLPEVREALVEMLRQLGLRTDCAASGEEAIAMALAAGRAGDPYRVHVLDWRMPGIDGVETVRRLSAAGMPAVARIVMISAYDGDDLRHSANAAGVDAVLVKPVSFSALNDALIEAKPLPAPAAVVPAAGHDVFAALKASRSGARVLLAEDNAVNQEVGVELLIAAGLLVDVASNGAEALAMVRDGSYDLVLMDMQMPVLDGLQATREIRARPGGHAVPVIAMTANAFGEDRDACIAAGMNDHVAKPVDPTRLYETLLRWLPIPLDDASSERGRPPAQADDGDDIGAALRRIDGLDVDAGLRPFGGTMSIYLRIAGRFAQVYAAGMPQLAAAIAGADSAAAAAAAHSLRGASATIGAVRVERHAAALEALGKAGAPASAWLDEARALQHALAEIVASLTTVFVAISAQTGTAGEPVPSMQPATRGRRRP